MSDGVQTQVLTSLKSKFNASKHLPDLGLLFNDALRVIFYVSQNGAMCPLNMAIFEVIYIFDVFTTNFFVIMNVS